MNIGKISSATEAYKVNQYNKPDINLKEADKASKISEQISQKNVDRNVNRTTERDSENTNKSKTSFSKEAAKLTISDEGKKIASDNRKVVLENNDGKVIDKKAVEKKTIESKSQADKTDEKISNLTGYTSTQVETLYRQGKVTYDDYEKKMEKIQELRDAVRNDDTQNKVNESKITENRNINEDNVKRSDNKNQDSNKEEKTNEKAKEATKETIESNKKQSEALGKMLKNEEKLETESKAYEKAIENDRLELVKPIFDEEKTKEMQFAVGNV